MFERRLLLGAAIGSVVTPVAALAQATPPLAAARLSELGPENQAMAQRAGLWDVTETVWDRPSAAPATTTGLVAERRMIGSVLQEFLRPVDDTAGRDIKRIDYLRFNRVEGQWDYVSMEMRAPVGIMPAWSFERGENATINLTFAPFAVVSAEADVTGQMLRMTQTIAYGASDREVKDQFFLLADGTGTKWLAHRYAYKRRA
jgi:hypothetical protein